MTERNAIQSPATTSSSNTSVKVLENPQKKNVVVIDDRLDSDFDDARSTILRTIERMNEVADISTTIATETGEPRAVEVANQALKNLIDASKKLLEAHEKKTAMKTHQAKIDLELTDNTPAQPQTVNNQQFVFNGTTKDLLDYIEAQKNKTIEHE